jgi:hypothetical protein
VNKIIERRLQQKSSEDKQDQEEKGQVDLLDLFMQSTRNKDAWQGCVFSQAVSLSSYQF